MPVFDADAAVHRLQGEGGRLILVASPAGQRGNFGQTNYGAAKAGLMGMTFVWSLELGKYGVTVNEQVFTAAFHDTAEQFERVFARLFPGGEGRLEVDSGLLEVFAHRGDVVVEAAFDQKVRKLIYCSTCGVHGNIVAPACRRARISACFTRSYV